jgi:hypothetical protein
MSSMWRRVPYAWLWAAILTAQPESSPDGILARIQTKARENLDRMPDYVCVQTVERSHRSTAKEEFKLQDTLRLQVALIGNREYYAWLDARKFEDKELRDLVGKGALGTGNFALHAKHVFEPRIAEFKPRGEVIYRDRRALSYDYEVPWENSAYRIRNPPHEEVVAFRGSLLVDAETLDLLRLDVHADEIPPELGLDRVSTTLDYARATIGILECLLPKSSEMTMLALDGAESRNRIQLGECRQYETESKLLVDAPPAEPAAQAEKAATPELPSRLTLELSLDADVPLETAVVGDPIRAVLARQLKDGEQLLAPAGSVALGNIVRLERQGQPFDHYEIALEFHTLETSQGRYEYSATMTEAGPATGLIRQVKKLNPTFTRQRKAKMDILVREVPRGQGVLHWDAKHPRMRKGLRMRWLTE